MSFFLAGLGVATPEHALRADDAVEMARRLCCRSPREERLAQAVIRRSGVRERRTVVPHAEAYRWEQQDGGPTTAERMAIFAEHAPPLALRSAELALADARAPANEVTHLVTVSCTGFEAPGVDVALIEGLGLAPTTQRVHVGFMGCHGAINGLRVAHGLAASDPNAVVLVNATELCSLHYAWGWDPERLVGNALFADGSATLVGAARGSGSAASAWRVKATGSRMLPDSARLMSWRVLDHGFEMTLSSELPDAIQEHLAGWLVEWVASHGLALDGIAAWAIHPGGPRIVDAVESALGLSPEQTRASRETLEEHGNMSSPTVLFLLDRLRREGKTGPVLMIGFGPGIFAEVALWE